MRRLLVFLGPGIVVGAALCLLAFIVGSLKNGDSTIAQYEILGMASRPLSSVLGDAAYRAKEHTTSGVLWSVIDYGQVLLNWMLLSLVIVGSFRLLRRSWN